MVVLRCRDRRGDAAQALAQQRDESQQGGAHGQQRRRTERRAHTSPSDFAASAGCTCSMASVMLPICSMACMTASMASKRAAHPGREEADFNSCVRHGCMYWHENPPSESAGGCPGQLSFARGGKANCRN
jgi:hypothetical protein